MAVCPVKIINSKFIRFSNNARMVGGVGVVSIVIMHLSFRVATCASIWRHMSMHSFMFNDVPNESRLNVS